MKTTGIDFEEFLSTYDKIDYFECIMYPDGTLEEATPSHTYKMCEIYDDTKSIKEIEMQIPTSDSPIEWLLCETNCVALWYNSIMIDDRKQSLTDIQKRNIKELMKRGYIILPEDIFECFEERKRRYEENFYSPGENKNCLSY